MTRNLEQTRNFYINLQELNKNMKKVVIDYIDNKKTEIKVSENTHLTYILIGLKSGEKDIVIRMEGKQAKADLIGIFIGKNNTDMKVRTLQHHLSPYSVSDLVFKSVLYDQSKFSYQGLIKIENEAQDTNAYQKNDNLILSPSAHVDTKPELEILADQVKCSHGATVGQIDKEQIFYLTSRGLPQKEAERIIIEGFLKSVLERIEDKDAYDKVQKIIEQNL